MTWVCVFCDREFYAVTPVRDPDEVSWRGDQAQVFCTQECMAGYAERASCSA